ncbi:THAP domain-containing protein 1-like [Ornithodoros turicata]|uniref:THAP domain-containing protein 1-like n=1 Tax=Ornithodoros turicata TaxID=34597 RepID=UPI003139E747
MVVCCYSGCANRSEFASKASGITYHHFPRDESLRLQWVNAIGRPDWVPTKYSRVCSKHFRNEDFDRTSLTRVRLREGSVPVAHPSVQVHQEEHDLPARREPSGQEPIGVCTPEPGTSNVSLPEPDTQEEIEVSMASGSDTQEPMDVGLLEPKTPERIHVDRTTSTPLVSAVSSPTPAKASSSISSDTPGQFEQSRTGSSVCLFTSLTPNTSRPDPMDTTPSGSTPSTSRCEPLMDLIKRNGVEKLL